MLAVAPSGWATSTFHIGTGVGTACAIGCTGDPTVVSAGAFSLYFNPDPNSSQGPVGTPFYLIVATPIYSGSANNASMNSIADWYHPYPGPKTGTVIVDNKKNWGPMTSGDLYEFIGLGASVNNSYNFVNMRSCDIGTSQGGDKCPNSSLQNNGAPLPGFTITGYMVLTWNIETTAFAPGDLLQFKGAMPKGSYISAAGVNSGTTWAVPFTESGITVVTVTPEPGTLVSLSMGLAAIAVWLKRSKI
jgi:hypothetical protein